jgi:putative DNA methylase
MRKKPSGKGDEYQFRAVTAGDLKREQKVIDYVGANLAAWQEKGYVPDMVIETGEKTDEPIRTRGWTHWHHLFNPRQLLVLGFVNMNKSAHFSIKLPLLGDRSSKLNRWDNSVSKGCGNTANVFDNQALNTLLNYGCRASAGLKDQIEQTFKSYLISTSTTINSHPAQELTTENDIYITDPPYGDAVKYEEITEFFIAWLHKNPPPEFAHWTWDSRRSLAIKGEGEGFRSGMIAAYRKMAEKMPDNGIQVLMFTHRSGNIWADMTHIIWASGLQVTAAWYVVTETDSALRQGANVTGTGV